MNQNQIGRTGFDIDEETDAFYLQKAAEYQEWLIQQEAQPRLTRTPIFRDREDAERRLRADYFDDHCKYPLYYFRRRFRMSRKFFLKIVNGISSYTADPLPQHFHFFTSRLDCTGRMSISALMKCTTVIRQMAYGSTPDAFDEYLQMSEYTARDALFFFNMCIIELYMPKYTPHDAEIRTSKWCPLSTFVPTTMAPMRRTYSGRLCATRDSCGFMQYALRTTICSS
ncbi:hypothetical protein Tco_1564469 [Tanacetum coccineum]